MLNTRVTVSQFLGHVAAVAKLLPDKQFAINLCENRYFFMVSFCAVIIKNQTNLLPPNKNRMTQQWLIEKYGDVYVVEDISLDKSINFTSFIDCEQGLESSMPKHLMLNVLDANFRSAREVTSIPNVPLNHLAAICFTSGSTGESKPNKKSWQTIVESSRINTSNMLKDRDELLYQLATVPPQHMWGLETSVLLPLFSAICVADLKPLFPQDIFDALRALPIPRMLVSSPIHLRALIKSGASSSSHVPIVIDLTLCATSPLSKNLAEDIESLFSSTLSSAQLREVYGCSEIGSMAVRQTSKSDVWQLFKGISFSSQKDNKILACTQYLPNKIEISDEIKMIDNDHFLLKGRSSDMINIAGKRGSLQEINNILLKFSEVIDGVIFIPNKNSKIERLSAIVVISDHIEINTVKDYLKLHLDAAFVPRIILKVKSLPRQENGKLPLADLLKFYQRLIKEK